MSTIEQLALAVRRLERIRAAMRPIRGCEFESQDETWMGCVTPGEPSCRWQIRNTESPLSDEDACPACRSFMASSEHVTPRLYRARRRLRAALDRVLRNGSRE